MSIPPPIEVATSLTHDPCRRHQRMTHAGDIPPTQVMRPSTHRHYVRSFGNRPYRLRWLQDCNGSLGSSKPSSVFIA